MSGTLRAFDVGERPRLEVRVPSGRVDITRGARGRIEVEVSGPGSDRVELGQIGDTVVVDRSDGFGRGKVNVTARVPEGCDVEAALGAADLRADVALGEATIRSAAGDVRLESAKSLVVSLASGDLDVEAVAGRARVNTASGDVAARVVEGDLVCSTASGDVAIGEVTGDVTVKTASGDVRLSRCEGTEVRVSTVSGDTCVGLPPGRRVEVDINSLTGRVRLPEPSGAGEAPTPRATVRLKCVSVSGDVEVRRA
jgi:hypothetical protein